MSELVEWVGVSELVEVMVGGMSGGESEKGKGSVVRDAISCHLWSSSLDIVA